MIDIAIVGSGPAGLSAAIYAARAGYTTVVFEQLSVGGQLTSINLLENYPGYAQGVSGFDFAFSLKEQAERFGAQIVYEQVLNIEEVQDKDSRDMQTCENSKSEDVSINVSNSEQNSQTKMNLTSKTQEKMPKASDLHSSRLDGSKHFVITTPAERHEARVVILATGAQPKKLPLKTARALEGRGVSYCATCDGNFFRGKDVVVVGGGDTACADVLYLSKIAAQVHLIHRRTELRANRWYQDKLLELDNVIMYRGFVVSDAFESDGKLSGIEIQNVESRDKETIPCSGLFVAIGTQPSTGWLDGFVSCDKNGAICSDDEGRTSRSGVFVAGDVKADSLRQVVTAASEGAIAVSSAAKFLASC